MERSALWFFYMPSLILLVGVMILVYPMECYDTLTIFGVATLSFTEPMN